MFTGIIEKTGTLRELSRINGGFSASIEHAPWSIPLDPGESVAVQGVCLTVVRGTATSFDCDLLDETIARTHMARRKQGDRVNLERALRLGDRIGGHLVTGHVDGTGRVVSIRPAGRDRAIEIACDAALLSGIVEKGSVACEGVSLTVARLGSSSFEVNVIPFTWESTTLPQLRAGDPVNIETDLLGKYVRRHFDAVAQAPDVTLAGLRDAGFT
jgi:riboflavin synthase